MNRTVVIGVDGVSFRYLDAFADDLPNVQALREEGVEAPLESTFPPWTPSAWPSIYTGRYPAEHGVHSFFTYPDNDPTQRRVVSRNDVDAPALWNHADAAGLTSVVLNVPVTHPTEAIDGAVLPGYLATEGSPGYPDDIRDRLADAGVDWRIYASEETAPSGPEKLDSYVDLVDSRSRATEKLLSEFDWEFAFIQVQKTDAVFHNFKTEAAFRRVYQAMDRVVGTVCDIVDDDDTVIIVSDHGIKPVTGHTVYVNEFLREAGLLTATAKPVDIDFKQRVLADETESANVSQKAALLDAASRIGLSPGRVFGWLQRVGVGQTVRQLLPDSIRAAANARPDYALSYAYCRLGSEMGVRLNLAGRDPGGVVTQEAYETVRDDVIDCLADARAPDGTPIFEFVDRYETVTDQEPTGDAPDVVFLPREMNHTISHRMPGTTMLSVDAHDHARRGAFVARGPSIADTPPTVNAVAVAPVVLATLGVGVPTELADRIPDGLLTELPDYVDNDVPYGSSGTERSDDVTDHLEDLGYL